MKQTIPTKGSYLVLGFIPDDNPKITGRPLPTHGVHTPLRSDGYYGECGGPPIGLAQSWREKPIHPLERVVVVQVVEDGVETDGEDEGH